MGRARRTSRLFRWLQDGARRELREAESRPVLDDLVDDLTQSLLNHEPTVACLELHRLLALDEDVELPEGLRRHTFEECDLCSLRILLQRGASEHDLAPLLFALEPLVDLAVRRLAERTP